MLDGRDRLGGLRRRCGDRAARSRIGVADRALAARVRGVRGVLRCRPCAWQRGAIDRPAGAGDRSLRRLLAQMRTSAESVLGERIRLRPFVAGDRASAGRRTTAARIRAGARRDRRADPRRRCGSDASRISRGRNTGSFRWRWPRRPRSPCCWPGIAPRAVRPAGSAKPPTCLRWASRSCSRRRPIFDIERDVGCRDPRAAVCVGALVLIASWNDDRVRVGHWILPPR